MSDQSMLWGHLIAFWDVWGFRLMVAGGVLGFFALVSSLLSSFVLYRVDGAQKDLLSAQSRAFAEKIGTLNRDAEALKASNLKLEAQIAPRRISEADCRIIASRLRMFARRNVEVSSYALDTEGAALGQQILSCLRLANINANDQRLSVSAMGGVNFGIVISGNDPALNGALRDSLEIHGRLFVAPFGTPLMHGAGIVAHMGPVVNPDATVFIGAKPIAQ